VLCVDDAPRFFSHTINGPEGCKAVVKHSLASLDGDASVFAQVFELGYECAEVGQFQPTQFMGLQVENLLSV
jgi:hypothetical protein